MTHEISEALLWLFVINLGISFGAGAYEKRIIHPEWFSSSTDSGFRVNSEAMRRTNTGLRFWAYVTTGPLTLVTLANLVAAFQSHGTRHDWWLAAVAITLIERAGTFSFFIPTAIKLMRSDALVASSSAQLGLRWMRLNDIREGLTLIAWLAALRAFSLPT